MALTTGLVAVPLLMAAAGGVEFASAHKERAQMQDAADAGALAGAGKLAVATYNQNTDGIRQIAVDTAMDQLNDLPKSTSVQFTAEVDLTKGLVTVTGVADRKSLMGFMKIGETRMSVVAQAENLQKVPLCVLQTMDGGLSVENTAYIKAPGCAIHANHDINVTASAMIEADRIQAAGKVSGVTKPQGNSGAMTIPDPFTDMDLKPPLPCLPVSIRAVLIKSTTIYLPPGVHCDILQVVDSGKLYLLPGEHYFMSPLSLAGKGQIEGDDVVLIFGGKQKFDFADNGEVRISARRSGKFAGFLIVTSRDNTQKFTIKSDRVSQLLGTIYIPNAELEIETAGSVAQDSAWSVIVARTLTLRKDPVLVINNRYAGSGVPVPQGVGPSRIAPVLTK
ncbi:pilus assembly protein TadG-related protein [Asticcacaulis sp. BYS171W]|uniref:Pilus assembly protein TadG-related protein n=1 Tax=Asticcacaulis aquaticus TaxID=2984212 RepID=A0ABT5HXS0_9CAUL|nr:pilus assembly protein TadG-related protein [Asticcacaulis aquaticus]MDC7684867.1 pilus assembly protein TadG-related protein [Asticcacaulis aquaticus]